LIDPVADDDSPQKEVKRKRVTAAMKKVNVTSEAGEMKFVRSCLVALRVLKVYSSNDFSELHVLFYLECCTLNFISS
jgi:hypothetical protein